MERHDVNILIGVSALVVLFAVFGAQLGYFTVDEAIYVFAADTFRMTGGLILNNGWELGQSVDLQWTELLTVGPGGLTSQYPPGTAWLWGGSIALFGERSVVLLNALATVGCVFVTRALTIELFGDRRLGFWAAILFLFGTFTLEYAFVYWPHMQSILPMALGALFFLRALDREAGVVVLAALSGLCIGASMLLRLDSVLILPVIAILGILYAARPVLLFVGGALGLLPPMAALSAANMVKFGTLNPISYGGKAGSTNLAAYMPFFAVMAVALLALILVRLRGERGVPRPWLWVGAVAVTLVVVAVPQVQELAHRVWRGVVALIVDARTLESPFTDVVDMPDGTKMFWDLSKKAVGQSMPWLGVLGLMIAAAPWRAHRRSLVIVLVLLVVWSMPFLMRVWHGGMSSNMRYFLPVFPFLAPLAVVLIAGLYERAQSQPRVLLYAVVGGFCLAFFWVLRLPASLAGAHQIMSLWVFLAVLALSLAAALIASRALARVALFVVGIGLGVSGFNTLSDSAIAQLRREAQRPLSDLAEGMPGRALIYDFLFRSAMLNPDQIVATPIFRHGPDAELVARALEEGYRVYMPPELADRFLGDTPGYVVGPKVESKAEAVEILRRP